MKKIILVYHSIGNDDLFLQVPLKHFMEQIEYIETFLSPQKLSDFLNKKNSKRKEVLIMFDDAFRDSLPAMDYLERKKVPFSIAIVDKYLHDMRYCSVEDLMQFQNASFVFHTHSHKKLIGLSDEEIIKEITPIESSSLGLEKKVLVYPEGLFDENVIRVSKLQGYEWGFSCLPFHFDKRYKNKKFKIPRVNVNGYLSFRKFRFFLSYFGNIYLHAAYIKRRILRENYLDK